MSSILAYLPLFIRSSRVACLALKMQGQKHTLILQLFILLTYLREITCSLRKIIKWMSTLLLRGSSFSIIERTNYNSLPYWMLVVCIIYPYISQDMMGTVNLVKNFLTTPAIAYPLNQSMFFSGLTEVIFDSYIIISYSYQIDPLFLNMPYKFKNYGRLFTV